MRLGLLDILKLTSFPAVLAVGQLLFKKTSTLAVAGSLVETLAVYLSHPAFYCALALYGFATGLWLWILANYPLTLAYSFSALAIVFVPLLERAFYAERLSAGFWLGVALLILGLLTIVHSKGS